MKKIIFIALLIIIAYSSTGFIPRSDIMCDGTVPGSFWDGQKCENCANAYCFCTSINGCDRCANGFMLHSWKTKNDPTYPNTTCEPCNSQGQVDFYQSSPISSCCSQGEGIIVADTGLPPLALRATQCNGTNNFSIYGSYCYTIPGCASIANKYMQCDSCLIGYYMTKGRTCTLCSTAMANCDQCNGPYQCSKCQQGFYLINNQNNKDNPNDIPQFNDPTQQCLPCSPTNCYCSGVWNNGSQSLCEGCINPYDVYDPQAKNCTSCNIKYCAQCNKTNLTQCILCQTNYTLYNGTCFKLPDNCYKGVIWTDNQTIVCDPNSCYNGYYYDDGTAGQFTPTCIMCDLNVARCKGPKGSVYTQCGIGGPDQIRGNPQQGNRNLFYLIQLVDSSYQCVQNQKSCKKMRTSVQLDQIGLCDTCYLEFGFMNPVSGICFQCTQNCVNCTLDTNNQQVCTQCIDQQDQANVQYTNITNYYLLNGICLPCAQGCYKCIDSSQCQQCQTGFYLVSSSSCGMCGTNCNSCDANNSCKQCFDGFYLFNDTKNNNVTCIPCDSPACVSCTSSRSQCTTCKAGYFLDGASCVPDEKNCLQWTSNGVCQLCAYNYRLISGACLLGAVPGQAYLDSDNGCGAGNSREQADGMWLPPTSS